MLKTLTLMDFYKKPGSIIAPATSMFGVKSKIKKYNRELKKKTSETNKKK